MDITIWPITYGEVFVFMRKHVTWAAWPCGVAVHCPAFAIPHYKVLSKALRWSCPAIPTSRHTSPHQTRIEPHAYTRISRKAKMAKEKESNRLKDSSRNIRHTKLEPTDPPMHINPLPPCLKRDFFRMHRA